MARGGKRDGSGRKVSALTTKTREIAEQAIEGGVTPLDYMLELMRNIEAPADQRFEAAKAAAPYIHPRLAAMEHTGKDGGPLQITVQRFTGE